MPHGAVGQDQMTGAKSASLLRDHSSAVRVSNIALFFDLIYIFTITQLSHHLLGNPTCEGAWQTLVLLAAIWLAWIYTTWTTNYLDPERLPLRLRNTHAPCVSYVCRMCVVCVSYVCRMPA